MAPRTSGDAFLRAVAPIVSVISTGATDARRDYLHPRATLLAALGAASRAPATPQRPDRTTRPAEPILFVTRLAGALRYMGQAIQVDVGRDGQILSRNATKPFCALERSNYGIVHVRSDGKRFLVARHGSGPEKKEAYAYRSLGDSRFVADAVHRRWSCGDRPQFPEPKAGFDAQKIASAISSFVKGTSRGRWRSNELATRVRKARTLAEAINGCCTRHRLGQRREADGACRCRATSIIQSATGEDLKKVRAAIEKHVKELDSLVAQAA
jgi:hypothetical protein